MYNKIYNIAHKISNFISMKFKGKQYEVQHLIDFITKKYKENPNIKVLDIGCDEGRLTQLVKNTIGKNLNIVGIDINKAAIKIAKKNFKDINFFLNNKNFIEKNKHKFDIIYSSHVLEHVLNINDFINTKIKLLKKNGNIIIIIPQERIRGDLQLIHILFNFFTLKFQNPHIRKLTKQNLIKIMNEKGFKLNKFIFTNLFFPYKTKIRRFDSIGFNGYFNKK